MNYNKSQPPFPKGTYLLFDDDCGVCTTFSHLLKRLLGRRADLIPMHIHQVEELGMSSIPESYWTSFHIVDDGVWTAEEDAILALASLLPLGFIWKRVAVFPLVKNFLMWFLSRMQATRKAECTIDL